jgi:hypothetical protein
MNNRFRLSALRLVSLLAVSAAAAFAAEGDPLAALKQGFAEPPAEARPTVRWWWFGPAVVQSQLEHEMNMMKAGGIGGFEVQPTYPLALDGQYPGLKNLKFLSPEFFSMLGFTAEKAKELGLRMDLTLGSGWPYGGPMFTRDEGAQTIGQGGTVQVAPGQTTVNAPAGGAGARGGRAGGRGGRGGGAPVAALLGPIKDAAPGTSPYLPLVINNGAAQLPSDLHGATQVTFFTTQAGIMEVKRPAYGAEGYVVDHYSPEAVAKFIKEVGEPEINAMGATNPPYTIFCDSLEVGGEGWTPNFLNDFKRLRGYDLTPVLPALFDDSFPKAAAIRADYGRTVAQVFNEVFVDTFSKLAKDHNSRFRLQAYGTPPTTLETYAHADVDEGEQYNWKAFAATRFAASASHLLGRPVTSAESFTWLHSPVYMAAPIDIKAELNLQLLNGINQILFHGWPYTAPGVEYPGWRFYAAAVFNDKNPWWLVMPDVTRYLTRLCYVLRQGAPANDVALYLPEEDALTEVRPNSLQLSGASAGLVNSLVNPYMPAILNAGYNLDFVDDALMAEHSSATDGRLAFGNVGYKVVILPAIIRMPLATLQKLADFADQGGILIAIGNAPTQAPGFLATAADQKAVLDLSQRLFHGPNAKGVVVPAAQLAATLAARLHSDVGYATPHPDVGFVHRHTDAGEVYFLANTSAQAVTDTGTFRTAGLSPQWWDPVTGHITAATVTGHGDGTTSVAVSLPAYGAQLLVFTNETLPPAPAAADGVTAPIDLSKDWDVTFKNASPEADPAPQHFATLHDWSNDAALKYFSGTATYEKKFDLPATFTPARVALSLGAGHAARVAGGRQGMRADFQGPIGDAAVVFVNGHRAGALWCPPYRVDVTGLLQPGSNTISIQVANRAVNFMSDLTHHPLPDYTALTADRTYGGNRFQPQDLNAIAPQPSGLLETVQLVAGNAP